MPRCPIRRLTNSCTKKAANTPRAMHRQGHAFNIKPAMRPNTHGAANMASPKCIELGKKKRSSVTNGTLTGALTGTVVCATSRKAKAQGTSVHQKAKSTVTTCNNT